MRPLIAGCTVGLGVSWNIANTGAVAETLARHYGVGLGAVGLLTSMVFFAEIAVMIPGGRAIDRWGARRAGLVALAACVAGNVLAAAVTGLAAALAARFVIGLGVGLGFVAGSVYVQSARRVSGAAAQGVYGGISLAGGGLALAIVPALEGWIGWSSPYVSGAVAAALAIGLVCLGPPTAGGAAGGAPPRVRALLTDRRLVRLGVLHSATFGFSVVLGTWVVTLLERNAGYGSAAAGAAGALVLVMGVVARPLGGWLAGGSRQATARLIATSAVLGATGGAVLASGGPAPVLVLATAAVGLAAGLPFGPVFTAAARSLPGNPGAAVGAMNLYAVVTIVLGAPLLGLAFSLPGDGRIGFAAVALLWAIAGAATGRGIAAMVARDAPARS
jgi:predicted MFS family arabinose efflux permease